MSAAEDEDPVGAFAADCADPAFDDGVRAGREYRCADGRDLFRGEHGIETSDELGVAIPDQQTQSIDTIAKVHEQIAGLLGHPQAVEWAVTPARCTPAGAELDKEQGTADAAHVLEQAERPLPAVQQSLWAIRRHGWLIRRLGGLAGALAPHTPTAGAAIAADRDQQRRRAPPQRLMRQPPGHAVERRSLASAASTPPGEPVGLDDPAGQHRTTGSIR